MPDSSKQHSPVQAVFQLLGKRWSGLNNNLLGFLYDRAGDLAVLRLFKAALKLYLYVFKETRTHPDWGGVRLSYLLSRIAEIGNSYQPADLALQKLCEESEEIMRSRDTDPHVVIEYTAICRYLDQMRVVRFHDELKGSHPEFANTLGWLKFFGIKKFLETKRYTDYSHDDCECFLKILQRKTRFPKGFLYVDGPEPSPYHKNWIVGMEADYYECILGAGHEALAAEYSQMLIEMAPTPETFITLIGAALRAGCTSAVEVLLNKADSTLGHDSMLHVLAESKKRAKGEQ